jgi:hypothetical protein
MQITNHQNLPLAIVQAVTNDPYDDGGADITVTSLIGPPRKRVLMRTYWNEIEEDVADRLWALCGQVGHGILGRSQDGAITEHRLKLQRLGWTVSGQFDLLAHDHVLTDYKFTSVRTTMDGVKPEWVQQLNLYAHMCREHNMRVDGARIIAIYRDWVKSRKHEDNYPARQVQVFDVPLWEHEFTESYLLQRIQLHQEAEGRLPECTAYERWAEPDTWAVKRKDRKRALRVLPSMAEAANWMRMQSYNGGQMYIEHRPGGSRRCNGYCNVAAFCEQWKKEKASCGQQQKRL